MVRANWKGLVGLGLIATGLVAWGVASAEERTLTVNEPGQPPLRCRVVQSWTEPNGSRAFQVQAISSGEMLTVVATAHAEGAPKPGKPVATRIYHWADGKSSPPGAPVPPARPAAFASKPSPVRQAQ